MSKKAVIEEEQVLSVSCEVIERKGSFATVKIQGNWVRGKVFKDEHGNEYVCATARFSTAPIFHKEK